MYFTERLASRHVWFQEAENVRWRQERVGGGCNSWANRLLFAPAFWKTKTATHFYPNRLESCYLWIPDYSSTWMAHFLLPDNNGIGMGAKSEHATLWISLTNCRGYDNLPNFQPWSNRQLLFSSGPMLFGFPWIYLNNWNFDFFFCFFTVRYLFRMAARAKIWKI